MKSKFQKFAECFTLSVLSLFSFFIGVEIILHFVFTPSKTPSENLPFFQKSLTIRSMYTGLVYKNAYFGYRYGPNSKFGEPNFKVAPLPEEFSLKYRVEDLVLKTNEWGFHVTNKHEENPFENTPGKIKIVCFGGSTMAGWGANYTESIPHYLHQKLQEKGIDSHTINAGVIAYYSLNEFLYYAMEIVHLDPDIAIFFDGFNDNYGHYYEPANYMPSIGSEMIEPPILLFLKSCIPNTIHVIERMINKIVPMKTEPEFFQRMRTNYNIQFEDILRNIIGISLAHNVTVILALQPKLNSKNQSAMTEYERYVARFCGQNGDLSKYENARNIYNTLKQEYSHSNRVIVLNLLNIFENVHETTYFDVVHYTAKGNEIIAKRLANEIAGLNSDFTVKMEVYNERKE